MLPDIFMSHESPLQRQQSPCSAWFFMLSLSFIAHESPAQQQHALLSLSPCLVLSQESPLQQQVSIAQHESAFFFWSL
jgi:hypothetical protein